MRIAIAMFVSGPMARIVTCPGFFETVLTRKSIALVVSGFEQQRHRIVLRDVGEVGIENNLLGLLRDGRGRQHRHYRRTGKYSLHGLLLQHSRH